MATETRTESPIDNRLALTVVALIAVATTLMLEATRVFLSYTVFVVDQSKRVELALIAVGVCLAFGLAAVILNLLGVRSAIVLAAGALIVARLGLQFWDAPVARIVLGAAATICWGWLLVAALGVARDPAALGVGIGLAIDFSIRIVSLTVDLPWMPNANRDLVMLLLGVVAIGSVIELGRFALPDLSETDGLRAVSFAAIGPALVIYHLAIGNPGFLAVQADDDRPTGGIFTLFGMLLGLTEMWRARPREWSVWRERLDLLVISMLPVLGLGLLWRDTGLKNAWVIACAAGTTLLLMRALGSGGTSPNRDGITATTAWVTIGTLTQTALVFAYFTFSGHPVPLAIAAFLIAGIVWLTQNGRPVFSLWTPPRWKYGRLLPPFIFGIVSIVALIRYDRSDYGERLGVDVTVMTYNIQLGFSRDNHWSLEETARTIEAEDPDVVILQEVSRGWVIASGVDQVEWLSQRLDMQVVFGGASRDGLWGNAILTKAPIRSETKTSFTTTVNLRRGMVMVQVATDAGDLWIMATHLDNPDDAGDVRLQQVEELLAEWNGLTPAILAGDFNATPDSDVLAALTQAGFVDTGASLPADAFTSENGNRIDYVMVAGPITTREVRIPDVWTSDHKPVVAEVTMGG